MSIKIITYVLDDDVQELELLQQFLSLVCGADLRMFTRTKDFIRAIEQGCHIAIIDNHMPDAENGIEIGKMVLEKNPLCFLIMFSGSNSRQLVIDAMNAGFRAYVDKNQVDAYIKVASIVEKQLPKIKLGISICNRYSELNENPRPYV